MCNCPLARSCSKARRCLAGVELGEQRHIDVQLRHPLAELGVVLLGQHLSGRHESPLKARINGG